jgi:hypothetical protein
MAQGHSSIARKPVGKPQRLQERLKRVEIQCSQPSQVLLSPALHRIYKYINAAATCKIPGCRHATQKLTNGSTDYCSPAHQTYDS